MTWTRAAVLVAGVLWGGWTAPAYSAVEVNTCGQRFSGDGFLTANLDCSGQMGTPIVIDGGSLDLRGFTLTAHNVDLSGAYGAYAVLCEGSCRVSGGGGAIVADGNRTGGDLAALAAEGNIVVTDLTVRDSSWIGIFAVRSGRVFNSTVTGSRSYGIASRLRLKLVNSSVAGGEYGAASDRLVVQGSTISGSSEFGLDGYISMRLIDSTVTGNGVDPECGNTVLCADVATEDGQRPRLINSTCDTSLHFVEGVPSASGTWCVCARDGC